MHDPRTEPRPPLSLWSDVYTGLGGYPGPRGTLGPRKEDGQGPRPGVSRGTHSQGSNTKNPIGPGPRQTGPLTTLSPKPLPCRDPESSLSPLPPRPDTPPVSTHLPSSGCPGYLPRTYLPDERNRDSLRPGSTGGPRMGVRGGLFELVKFLPLFTREGKAPRKTVSFDSQRRSRFFPARDTQGIYLKVSVSG